MLGVIPTGSVSTRNCRGNRETPVQNNSHGATFRTLVSFTELGEMEEKGWERERKKQRFTGTSEMGRLHHSEEAAWEHSEMGRLYHSEKAAWEHSVIGRLRHSEEATWEHSVMGRLPHSKEAAWEHSEMDRLDHNKETAWEHSDRQASL